MAIKIGLDAGHGLNTKGKQTPDGIKEWTLNDKVADKVTAILKDYDCEIIRTDNNEGNTDESLASRLTKYKSKGVVAFVSIHHNAFTSDWNNATGVEVFTDKKATSKDTKLAKCIYKRLVKYTGLKGRGVKKENWYVINQSVIPAVLVEGGFMDSNIDYKVITSDAGQTAYAKAVAEGLIEFLGLKKKAVKTPSTSSKKPATSSTTTSSNKIDSVKEVQSWVNKEYTFADITVDGVYGKNTKKALIKALQTELNQNYKKSLKVDGVWGSKTKSVIKTLKKGSKNDVVKVLQALLVCNGYTKACVDGNYGTDTYNAVKSYQSKKGLSADGKAGKNTFAKLCG